MPPRRTPSGPTLVEQTLTGRVVVAPGTAFEQCSFESANLQGADLSGCRFVDCTFSASNLSVARVAGCAFQSVTFRDCKLSGIDWTPVARLGDVTFEKCVLDQCGFVGMDLERRVFRGSRLRDAVFDGTNLTSADLRDTDLTGARFARTKLVKADLRGARGYVIDPVVNAVKGLRASMPEAAGLVVSLGVEIDF